MEAKVKSEYKLNKFCKNSIDLFLIGIHKSSMKGWNTL